MTAYNINTLQMQELNFYQLQQQTQQLMQQNAYLAAQLQLTRSHSLHNQQSLPTTNAAPTKQPAQRSLSDVSSYYLNSNQKGLNSLPTCTPPGLSTPPTPTAQKPVILAQLPQPPCISLQRRESTKSEGGSTGTENATRYKTEMCRPFEETGQCRYGSKCQFAHGVNELRGLNRHPRYKTEFCRTFHTTGFCSYGQRCNFIHNEDERRPVQQNNVSINARPQALQINNTNQHKPLTLTSSTGSSPASSIYGDISPTHSPNYLSEDPFTSSTGSRLSPAPSLSSFTSDISGRSFPSPPSTPHHSDVFSSSEAHLLSTPLDLDLSSLLSKLDFGEPNMM